MSSSSLTVPFQLINIYAQASPAFSTSRSARSLCAADNRAVRRGTRVRLFLLFGMVTHCALDVLFTEVSGRVTGPGELADMAVGLNLAGDDHLGGGPRGAHCKKLLACRRAERATEETSGNA